MKPHEYNTEERLVAANEEVVECMEALKKLIFLDLCSIDHESEGDAVMGIATSAFQIAKEIARHSERAGMLKAALAVQEAYKQQL